jgi:hypothetical protein
VIQQGDHSPRLFPCCVHPRARMETSLPSAWFCKTRTPLANSDRWLAAVFSNHAPTHAQPPLATPTGDSPSRVNVKHFPPGGSAPLANRLWSTGGCDTLRREYKQCEEARANTQQEYWEKSVAFSTRWKWWDEWSWQRRLWVMDEQSPRAECAWDRGPYESK